MIRVDNVDQEIIKDSNKKRILNLIFKKRELTKQDIAKEIGISIPTVISNINELILEGLVEEGGVGDSTGGRKPVIIKFLPNSKFAFGVEFNIDSVRIILTNLDSEIIFDDSFSISGLKNIDEIMLKVHQVVSFVVRERRLDKKSILGIGFALPGTVNEEKLVLELAPNLGIKNLNFSKFNEIMEYPLYIENEANAAAFAELTLGIAKEMRNLVYLSTSNGIGTGIVIQDHLYKGKNKRAGEFGHMIVEPGGKKCNCGRRGCWELYASQRALLEAYNSDNQEPVLTLDEFFQRVNYKEEKAEKVLDNYLNLLAIGIQNIVLILDPHYVVIGGEISKYSDIFLESLNKKVFVENSFYDRSDLKIFPSILKQNSSILGAALLPLQKIFYINEKIM